MSARNNDDSNGTVAVSDEGRPAAGTPALRLRQVSKTFPGVRALVDADLVVAPGSIHALLGHNGSGKSTLIKCLAGVHSPDPGSEATIFGETLSLGDARDATLKGLRFVHQDLGIIPELGAVDNIGFVCGYRRGPLGTISWRRQAERSIELLGRFGFTLDPERPLAEATPPERTALAIVRAVSDWPAERGVLVLDEPTAALPTREVDRLFALIREISAHGAAVILVSHRLDEVIEIADHATVLRDGRVVWVGALGEVTLQSMVDLVAGTEAGEVQPAASTERPRPAGRPPALELRDVHGTYLHGVSLTVGEGEILGVAGLLGSGREELPYLVAGDRPLQARGVLLVGGEEIKHLTIRGARGRGITLVPADRGGEGIFDGFTTAENVAVAALPALRHRGVVAPSTERSFAARWLGAVHADAAYGPRPISTLSGGNQQKAVLARALSVGPRLLVLSEPTAGIDVGARRVFYDEVRRRAVEGLGVLMASSDIEDLLACCDRVIALRDGVVAADLTGDRMNKSAIAYAIEGAHDERS